MSQLKIIGKTREILMREIDARDKSSTGSAHHHTTQTARIVPE
jgi:hypothetical protein